jgi:hypothetical protein
VLKGEFILEELSRETFETIEGKIYKKILSHPYEKMFSKNEFIEYLKEIGFKIKFEKIFHPLHIMKYFVIVAQK